MTEHTPATETDADHILFAPMSIASSSSPPVHLPDLDNPEQPKCGAKRSSGEPFRTKSADLCPASWRLCAVCDPDKENTRGGPQGPKLANRLEDADPDDVSRETAEANHA